MNRRRAKLLYDKVHPILVSLAKNSSEEVLKRQLQKEASFWIGFEKRAESVHTKRSYGEIPIESLDPHRNDEVWSSKIDGAHSVGILIKDKLPQFFSHRLSKKTGQPIEYTHKLPHIKSPSPVNAIVRGETYAVDKRGIAVHPDVVTQILNSGTEKSLALQKALGIKTRTALIDIDSWDGRDMKNAPFAEKRSLMAQIAKSSPDFVLPTLATTPKEKISLLARIRAGFHPETKEGVVVHRGSSFIKAKVDQEHDLVVRDIFPEESVKPGRQPMAGGFTYSWTPEGPIKGKVGTGFDHAMKKDMLENPDQYIGRVARVRSLSVSKNNVLVKPSFKLWHVEKNVNE